MRWFGPRQTVVANVSQRHGLIAASSSQPGPQPGPQSPPQSVPQSRSRHSQVRERPGGDADGCLNEPQDSSVYSSAIALEYPRSPLGAGLVAASGTNSGLDRCNDFGAPCPSIRRRGLPSSTACIIDRPGGHRIRTSSSPTTPPAGTSSVSRLPKQAPQTRRRVRAGASVHAARGPDYLVRSQVRVRGLWPCAALAPSLPGRHGRRLPA